MGAGLSPVPTGMIWRPHLLTAVRERTQIDASQIDDVILGCANQVGESSRNLARLAALLAGYPVEVPGMTLNRLCASGLQAVASASHAIRAEEGSLFVVGGVESMTRAPFVMLKSGAAWPRAVPEIADSTIGWRFTNPNLNPQWTISFPETAERIAQHYSISREEQDTNALESHKRAVAAITKNLFSRELVPLEIDSAQAQAGQISEDEGPRPNLSPATLNRLRPLHDRKGTVTAGNSSGLSDGAAALVLGTSSAQRYLPNAQPLARVLGAAVAGVDPAMMGLGPIPATHKLLKRLKIEPNQLDLIELGEAFAVQAIACIRQLELDESRVNIYGGSIALGYPLGCIGARLLVTLVHGLQRIRGRYGLVTMCTSVGQGMAMIVEAIHPDTKG